MVGKGAVNRHGDLEGEGQMARLGLSSQLLCGCTALSSAQGHSLSTHSLHPCLCQRPVSSTHREHGPRRPSAAQPGPAQQGPAIFVDGMALWPGARRDVACQVRLFLQLGLMATFKSKTDNRLVSLA